MARLWSEQLHGQRRAYADGAHAIAHGVVTAALILAAVVPATLDSSQPSRAFQVVAVPKPAEVRRADFGKVDASRDARYVADWVADSGDNQGVDFVIVDKRAAKMHVFDAAARLRASTPVLLGAARGDDSVPGIGMRPIAQINVKERTTPAGRFVGEQGRNARGEDVVWLDYDAAVSMHRVLTTNPAERRLARLATPTVEDKRISYGCINIPLAFYDTHIRPIFAAHRSVIYVLPEVKRVEQVFGGLPESHRQRHGRDPAQAG